MHTNLSIKVGTAGGTFLSIVPNIHSADFLKTVVLASVGAVVSFSISWLLKWILKKRKK
jgi:hypothetical protein